VGERLPSVTQVCTGGRVASELVSFGRSYQTEGDLLTLGLLRGNGRDPRTPDRV
jgi:hypothetical protein